MAATDLPELTVLLATAKGTPDDVAQEAALRVARYVQGKNPGRAVSVLQAGAEFQATAGRWQGWNGWIEFAGKGCRYGTNEPNYHLVVSPTEQVGRATANIFQVRLASGLPAALLLADGTVKRVVAVDERDGKDWKGGWLLRTEATHAAIGPNPVQVSDAVEDAPF